MTLKDFIYEAVSSGKSTFHRDNITERSSMDEIIEYLEDRDYKETSSFDVDEHSLRKRQYSIEDQRYKGMVYFYICNGSGESRYAFILFQNGSITAIEIHSADRPKENITPKELMEYINQ